jgi:hypothetical protein
VLAGAVTRSSLSSDIDLQPGTPLITGSVLGMADARRRARWR